MSTRRGSISDYPEHLNPFYEGNEKLRFWKFGKTKRSGSFRETLRNTLTFKSFRGKNKDKPGTPSSPPEIRKHDSTITSHQRQTLPSTLSPVYSPRYSTGPPLPRSRFSERVGKPSVNSEEVIQNGHVPLTIPEIPGTPNPFEEDEKVPELKPKRIRRRKRRAPLPPNMAREEGDTYLGVSSMHNLSKWSLTSVETDVSTYSENEHLSLDAVNQEMSEIMNNITKEMEKMTDDTHNDTKETLGEKPPSDIPDLIASSTEGIKKNEIDKLTDNIVVTAVSEHENSEHLTDENLNIVQNINCVEEEEVKNANNCEENSNTDAVEETNSKNYDESKNTASVEEKLKSTHNSDENEKIPSKSEGGSNNNSLYEESDANILYNASYNHAASIQELNFNERKSIFITASNDQLDKSDSSINITTTVENTENIDVNQNNNVSPPTSPRCKTEMNFIINNSHQDSDEQKGENEDVKTESVNHPIPKKRTNKLSKSDLLGNEMTENV